MKASLSLAHVLVIGLQITLAAANVEKVVFVAPDAAASTLPPALDNLCLDRLAPHTLKLQTGLATAFPTDTRPLGQTSWYLLSDLVPGTRYEVRLCWPASRPTSINIDIYGHSSLSVDSGALKEITAYAKTRGKTCTQAFDPSKSKSSALLLSINAAADYFASNGSLMQNPPEVPTEIILDPYLMNVIPQSLVPVGAFSVAILVLAISGSNYVYSFLQGWR